MKKVLITGARGFIGRHCFRPLLSKGYEIHAVSSRDQSKQRNRISKVIWHRADLLESGEIKGLMAKVQPSHLLHFAWCTTPGQFWTSPDNIRWVKSSLTLLETFLNNKGKRVVMAGTCAEYGPNGGICIEETTPISPETLYGSCKHALQLMLDSFSRQTGLSSAWGRIFHLYGPFEHPKRLVSSVILSLLQEKAALCSHGNQVRDLLYVEDAADAFVSLLESEFTGSVNIASGQPVPIKNIIEKIAAKLKRPDLVRLGALPSDEADPPLLAADGTRLKQINETPRFNIDEGLDKTIDWWKTQYRDKTKRNQAPQTTLMA